MPAKKYKVTLTTEEREKLTSIATKGTGNARRIRRAQMLLMADVNQKEGESKDAEIAKALNAHATTVERTRKKCVLEGIEAALNHTKPYKSRAKVLDGEAEAKLIQIACSPPPEGRERWTLNLLTEKLIEIEVVETVSSETVRMTLKKMNLSLG